MAQQIETIPMGANGSTQRKEENGNFLRNITISMKLSIGFGIILILMLLSMGLSVFGISRIGQQAVALLSGINEKVEESAISEQIAAVEHTERLSLTLIIALAAVSFLLTILVVLLVRRSILNPIREIVRVYGEMAEGKIGAEIQYESRDEIGQMAKLIRKTNTMESRILRDVIGKFTRIAQGDLHIRVDLDYPGDYAALKKAIVDTASAVNRTMQIIDSAAEQVSSGSAQVSSGAQALAAGSSEQAASVEELSASVATIAQHAQENSANVKVATQYVEQAGTGVDTGNEYMERLTKAMENIGSVSGQIANITEVIEDIASQTNILALNAAIEAAHAGVAGKGFAVVADEVRNLAAKSAEAANQTGELIRRSVSTVTEGTQITAQTAQILKDVREKAQQATDSIIKIEQASIEQASAIEQIKQGIMQVSSVVQTNAATAEENSATSEEMSAQAATLRDEVGKFQLDSEYEISGNAADLQLKEPTRENAAAPEAASVFGKY